MNRNTNRILNKELKIKYPGYRDSLCRFLLSMETISVERRLYYSRHS